MLTAFRTFGSKTAVMSVHCLSKLTDRSSVSLQVLKLVTFDLVDLVTSGLIPLI